MKIGFALVAVADLLSALFCTRAAIGFWRAGEQQENAGLAFIALFVFFVAFVSFAMAYSR